MLVHYTSVYGLGTPFFGTVIRPCMGSEVHVRRNINSEENILRTARSLAENLTGLFPMSTRPGTVRVTSEVGTRVSCQTGKNLGKRSLPIEIRRVDNIHARSALAMVNLIRLDNKDSPTILKLTASNQSSDNQGERLASSPTNTTSTH